MFGPLERSESQPLIGVRVLTVDNYFGGNYGPLLLALHGADVVKIERPEGGDVLRRDPPFAGAGDQVGHGVLRLLRSKSSVALDLATPEGREFFDSLVAETDVFWTNLRPESLRKSRLEYDDLRRVNGRIIYAALSGFGSDADQTSRFDGVPAFDIVIQAVAGLMARNADTDGVPQYNGIAVADQVSSLYGAFGVVMALMRRDRTGEGAFIDVSMFDSMIAVNEKTLTLSGMGFAQLPARRSATNAPFGPYRASDGYLVIGVGGPTLWRRFCNALNRPDLLERDDLRAGVDRVRLEETVLRPVIEEWLGALTVQQAVEILHRNEVPAAPVLEVDSEMLLDEARRRGVVADVEIPDVGTFPVVQSPVMIDGRHCGQPAPPAALGENAEDVRRRWTGRSTSNAAPSRAQQIDDL